MVRDIFFRLAAVVVSLPIFYFLAYILHRVITEVSLYVNIFLGTGLMVALVLFFAKRPERRRTVFHMSGDLDQTYNRLYQRFSEEGFHIEECEPLGGRQLNVFLDHPPQSRYLLMGLFFLLVGIFPGIVWFAYGPDKFSITLKPDPKVGEYIFKCSSRRASKAWEKISSKLLFEMLEKLKNESLPENLETTIDII
jgi:hypothetical protein